MDEGPQGPSDLYQLGRQWRTLHVPGLVMLPASQHQRGLTNTYTPAPWHHPGRANQLYVLPPDGAVGLEVHEWEVGDELESRPAFHRVLELGLCCVLGWWPRRVQPCYPCSGVPGDGVPSSAVIVPCLRAFALVVGYGGGTPCW